MIIWASQAVSLFGSAVVEFALAWYLTVKTGSATILATSMLVAVLPQVILGPFIGPYIDRWDRKRIMILADTAIALITLGLALLFWLDVIRIWQVYLAMAGRAIGQAFHFPASSAAVAMIVPEKDLPRAAGLSQTMQGIITIAGPPAGAFLFGILPVQGVLAVDIITALIAIGCLLLVAIPNPVRTPGTLRNSALKEMAEGFRYIWKWKGLVALVTVSAIVTFFITPAYTLLPIMVNQSLGGDVLKLGWLEASFGVGIIAGGLLLGVWPGFKKRVVTALLGVMICGLATVVLGLTARGWFAVGMAATFIIGFGMSFGNGPVMAVLQSTVEKGLQGRVFSLVGSIGAAIMPLGLAIVGPLSDAIGIELLYYLCGSAIVITVAAFFFVPALMHLEEQMKHPAAEQSQ